MRMTVAYAATLLAFLAIDLVWLGLIAKPFYRRALGRLRAERFCVLPAALLYLLFPAGIVMFAVLPGVEQGRIASAAALGGAFGFFAYATYDLTSWATLKEWPARLAVVDILWGTMLAAVAAAAGAWSIAG